MTHPTHGFAINPAWIAIAITLLVFLLFTPQAMAQSASGAKARVAMAVEMLEKERFDDVEPNLQQAEKYLEGLPAAEKDPIAKQIAEVRGSVESAKKAAAARKLKSRLNSDLTSAEDDLGPRPYDVEKKLKTISDKLASDEVTKTLDAADITAFKARVEEIRKKLSGGAGANETKEPPVTANLGSAKSRVMTARNDVEARRFENVEFYLEEAGKYLNGLPADQKAPVLKDIAEVRAQLAEGMKAEEVRKYEERLSRYISGADGNISSHPDASASDIAMTKELLASKEVKSTLSAERIGEIKARLAEVEKRLAEAKKADALDRANGFVNQLEEALTGDPLQGKDEFQAYKAWRELEYFQRAAKNWLAEIPEGDADRKGVEAKLADLRKKADGLSSKWGQAQVEATVKRAWELGQDSFSGWRDEKPNTAAKPNEMWAMPKTTAALRSAAWFLADESMKSLRAEHPDYPVVKATFADAEKTRDDAAAKLNEAFNAAMGIAEKWPTPIRQNRSDRVVASWMAGDAAEVFKGTKYAQANVERAKALDARWEKEIAEINRKAAELREKLSKEAAKAWPAIAAKFGADEDFRVRQLARSKGDRILMKEIYNRSGWDFDGGQYDFTVRVDGVAIGGNFSKEINDAVQAMWVKMDAPPLDSWEKWDVIAVVEGPAKIRRRVTTKIIDSQTREEIGKIEGYEAEDGVEVKIVALRAGPVAAGSK